MHYTQTPSRVRRLPNQGGRTLDIEGGGFVTQQMLEDTLADCASATRLPEGILVDLRDVAGYESGCGHRACEWLLGAHRLGVRRIAILASSAVLRTAAQLISRRGRVIVRTFESEESARRWLLDTTAGDPTSPRVTMHRRPA